MGTVIQRSVRVALLGLYSRQYPAIGESHGLSVVAGSLLSAMPPADLTMKVLDMVTWGEESTSRAMDVIQQMNANVLAIGLPYGTFSILRNEYPALRASISSPRPLIVFGGPVATYMNERIITEIEPESFVIKGEADDALPQLVRCWLDGVPMDTVPNISYRDPVTGHVVQTRRRLVDLTNSSPPYRGHVAGIRAAGGQVFSESSRGCSWAACTFCLRGLTDVRGRGIEYRRKPINLVADDLIDLKVLGIDNITFADEDFLGSSIEDAHQFVSALEARKVTFPKFDASFTVHSVFSRRDSTETDEKRKEIFVRLTQLGLQKAFLGIESCSPSQLKRYAKGHTREESVAATRRLQRLGIRVEIGVILFDPLCTLEEVEDSLRFMRDHGLVDHASGVVSQLRLQVSSHYLALLQNYERSYNTRLHATNFDPDTLAYDYRFRDATVERLFLVVNDWNKRLRPMYYPTKNLSRFGTTGAIGNSVFPVRHALREFRSNICDAVLAAIAASKSGESPEIALQHLMPAAAEKLADCVIGSLSPLSGSEKSHPVVGAAIEAALKVKLAMK